jgi:hypothetical protein
MSKDSYKKKKSYKNVAKKFSRKDHGSQWAIIPKTIHKWTEMKRMFIIINNPVIHIRSFHSGS